MNLMASTDYDISNFHFLTFFWGVKQIFDLKYFFDPQKNHQILKIDRFGAFLGVLKSLSFFAQ